MSTNFHEHFGGEPVPLPSERSTGLVFAAVAGIVAILYREDATVFSIAGAVGALFVAASLLAPHILKPLNLAWFRLGMLLGRVVSPVVMLVLYAVAIVPFGLVAQLRIDPLRKKREPGRASYWIERSKDGPPSSMTAQF